MNSDEQYTHTIGMAVHEVGQYKDNKFWPGIVFAIDPQPWIRDECIYIRLEDTVAVTGDGVHNLMGDCWHIFDQVEQRMAEPGSIRLGADLIVV